MLLSEPNPPSCQSVFLFLGPGVPRSLPQQTSNPVTQSTRVAWSHPVSNGGGRGRPCDESTRKQLSLLGQNGRCQQGRHPVPAPGATSEEKRTSHFMPDQRPAPLPRSIQKAGPCPRLLVLPFGANQYPIPRCPESLSQHQAEQRFCPLGGLSTSVQTTSLLPPKK